MSGSITSNGRGNTHSKHLTVQQSEIVRQLQPWGPCHRHDMAIRVHQWSRPTYPTPCAFTCHICITLQCCI